ncbi:hypothetical protein FKM82_005398 [Ascaphus truei]
MLLGQRRWPDNEAQLKNRQLYLLLAAHSWLLRWFFVNKISRTEMYRRCKSKACWRSSVNPNTGLASMLAQATHAHLSGTSLSSKGHSLLFPQPPKVLPLKTQSF